MNNLIQYYYNYFIDEKNDGYLLLVSSVCIKLLCGLYDKFVMDSIKPIEIIEKPLQLKYWEQAKRFYPDEPTRIKAMRAAYILTCITGKND